jgi:hypothetical protein
VALSGALAAQRDLVHDAGTRPAGAATREPDASPIARRLRATALRDRGRLPVTARRRGPGAHRTLKSGLVLEFEVDDENILLLREDELPIESELLDVLEITDEELLDLFETATKLLAEANPGDRMRAYVARDSSGRWQAELLPR